MVVVTKYFNKIIISDFSHKSDFFFCSPQEIQSLYFHIGMSLTNHRSQTQSKHTKCCFISNLPVCVAKAEGMSDMQKMAGYVHVVVFKIQLIISFQSFLSCE